MSLVKTNRVFYYLFMIPLLLCMCKGKQESSNKLTLATKPHNESEKKALDSLAKYGLYNYLDSAFWYTYIYFGVFKIKKCSTFNIDSVLPDLCSRRVISNDLILTHVRILKDSSFLFIGVTPLIKDSIISCYMLDGNQLPTEILFNYKQRTFVQFVYEENSWYRITDNPLDHYRRRVKEIINMDVKCNIQPHNKFNELYQKISRIK